MDSAHDMHRNASVAQELAHSIRFTHRGDWDTARACFRVARSMYWENMAEDFERMASKVRLFAKLALIGKDGTD